ncbi:FAD/NAD(P)-binding domain-containing protein [Laetiporus sulphureus 93-53]|uniref:FAD/NAD(P)-binding domain-containing protein n=1 Tax=Laetiporus sulphureus 93-53 TaxID=1314785 RepID=A0A165BYS1_9APHY|nr:FAD/NAD(P)-binding domain-containing protein [Laetiporus sulphureus 93-53]KZT01894.1 FAD/NAD(P)-binding domain-containing protein [Laetiporus sulphureus 93-53]
MAEPKFKVAIVGAGIGGLCFALSLHRSLANVSVDIYESTTVLSEVGAGIGVWPRVWKILKELGLEDDFLSITHMKDGQIAPHSLIYRKADQPQGIFVAETESPFVTYHRAQFHKVLKKHIPDSCKLHLSKRLTSYATKDSGEIGLQFADGSSGTCDVLVGCDGIKSTVRDVLYRSLAEQAKEAGDDAKASELLAKAKPVWTGKIMYRSLIPKDILEVASPGNPLSQKPHMCMGKDRFVITYPISQGQQINFGAYVSEPALEGTPYNRSWTRKCAKEEFIETFSMFESHMQDLLNCIGEVSAWAIHVLSPLPTYVDNRVALLGDAAHAMTPFQGSGAGQAIEDGFVLAAVLAHPRVTRETLPQALQVYDQIRRPFSQWVATNSRAAGQIYDLRGEGMEKLTLEESIAGGVSKAQLESMEKTLQSMFEWLKDGSVLPDRDRALEILEVTV